MKLPILFLLSATLVGSACRAPIVVDENGWPIGFATRQQPGHQVARVPQQGAVPTTQTGSVQNMNGAPVGDMGGFDAGASETVQRSEPLLGWNGDVVAGEADSQPTQSAPEHGIEPTGGGRMRIIELYQSVLDERDALRDELEAMTAALDGAQRQMIELEEQTKSMQQRILQLETRQQSMQAENLDLAARLTTSQIRRLEAEKLLLESRISTLRSQEPATEGEPQEASAMKADEESGT